MDGAVRRVPAIADAGVSRMINGPEAFTPDNEFILGESDVRGFFVAAGFCAHGIAGAGGIGRQMASWIVEGEPELDLWKMDIRRFGPAYRSQALHAGPDDRGATRPTTTSTTRTRSAMPAGRCGPSPTYELLAELGRRRSARSPGWERPNWFESNAAAGRRRAAAARLGRPALVAGDRGRGAGDAPGGRPVRRDVVREARGRRARARSRSCERMCANDIDRPVGSIVYTQLLDRRGGIQADLTVTRLADDRPS